MAKRADPDEVSSWCSDEAPAVAFGTVVVSAQWGEVVYIRRSTFGPGDGVVQIAVRGRHATPGKDARQMRRLDGAGLGCSRAAARDAGPGLAGRRVCYREPSLPIDLIDRHLACQVSDNRSVAPKLS